MLRDKRLLVTGPGGNIGYPLARELARDNEVWGISRFSRPEMRERVDALGVITRSIDLSSGDFGDLPEYFDYVLHIGATVGPDPNYDRAIEVNAEATALLMTHCRKAKAILVMSTASVYKPRPGQAHAFLETDPLGDANVPGAPTYSIAKIAEEAVARACARQLGIPTIITRMNPAYGETGSGGLPGMHFEQIRHGEPVFLRGDPANYNPIHDRDIFGQLDAMLDAATIPCPIVNWGGDVVVSAQHWCAYLGELIGIKPDIQVRAIANAQAGVIVDNSKRMAIAGPCRVDWKDGMRWLAEAHIRGANV